MMSPTVEVAVHRQGLRLMDPDLAVRAIGKAIEEDRADLVVADVDWGSTRAGDDRRGSATS